MSRSRAFSFFFAMNAQRTSNKGIAMSLLFDSLYKDPQQASYPPLQSVKRFYHASAPVYSETKPFASLVDRVKKLAARSFNA